MTTVPALTTLKLGYKDPLTDAFGAHPLLGAALDLNDGRAFTLAAPDGFSLSAPRRTLAPVGNIRTQGETVARGVYRHNRTARVRMTLGPLASYASLTSALRTLLQWLDAAPGIPFTLQYQAPNASQPSYVDVVGCAHQIPSDESQWLRLQLEPIEIVFICRPGLRGDRVTLQNLVMNPGFEAPFGGATSVAAPFVFGDGFSNANAYAVVAGSAPSVAANVMTIPASGQVKFGSPAWGAIQNWQIRFQWTNAGATIRFYAHYTDANNHLRVQVFSGGNGLSLRHMIGGSDNVLAQATIALTVGNWYWMRFAQFPSPPVSGGGLGNPPDVQCTLFNDSAGSIGAAVASLGPVPCADDATALVGAPQLAVVVGTLPVGGAFNAVHTVSLFGPGGWTAGGDFGTGIGSRAWEGSHAEYGMSGNAVAGTGTYPSGPVTSFGALRVDFPPGGTASIFSANYLGGSPAGTPAVPLRQVGDVLGWAYSVKGSGLGSSAQAGVQFAEYDAAGSFLRQNSIAVNASTLNAGWSRQAGTYTPGSGCAWVAVQLWAQDNVAGASANATVWFDNVQVWNVTQTGVAAGTMPYCELRFPNSAAQLVLSGILGDLPAPAFLAVGTFLSSLAQGGALSLYVGRRGQYSAGALLVAPAHGFYGAALSPQATAVLDSASYGGFYTALASLGASGWNPRPFSLKPSDAKGVYHLLARGRSQQVVGNLPQLTARVATQQLLSPWFGLAGGADQVATYAGPYMQPFTQQNVWTVYDSGQVAIPPFPVGSLTDLSQTYLTPRSQVGDASASPQGAQMNFGALLPVDGSLLVAVVNNPSNAPFAITNQWLWTYFDGLATAWGGDPGWTYSLESGPTPNPAHGGAGPGSQTSGNINVNSGADPCLTLDPSLMNSAGLSVQQVVASVSDQAGTVLPVACEVSYTPLYLWPR